MKNLKKWIIPIVLVVIIAFSIGGTNNKAVDLQEAYKAAWSNVESSYQRRADLIPNLVNTVKGAADFEKSTLTDVINARAKATSINVDADHLDAATIDKFQEAQQGLSSALSRLMVTVERYPDLKATQNFQSLQSQLEGTENRINVERNRFNESVKNYNQYIRHFPQNIYVKFLGFEQMTQFHADKGAEKAPEVEF